ncbi:cytochrome P450 family protein [Actinopolymorpha pittospori]|uniref:Cytochrome P450 n=1 Tax=Actinopolymorpha pittospori TaxID=648752 RepID=A0A927MUH8_9ACTN|nr:cytochrome P450 [Actinopolymorpha pittospori]MBE1606596.1 cytochrome P450 [Actinopolymorpha pittospori]
MTSVSQGRSDVPEIDLTDSEVLRDPFAAYGAIRERSPLARLVIPGLGPVWVVMRYDDARAMLGDSRLEITSGSFTPPPGIPEDCLPYLRTMSDASPPEHLRLRRLVAPAFSPRRAADFRPRIEPIVERLLDDLTEDAKDGPIDLLERFARPLPMEVICELVGIPLADRPRWREYGATVAAGMGEGFSVALPGIVAGAKAAIARRHDTPGDDVVSDLVRVRAEDGDRLSDREMVSLVWHLVLAGQTPTNLIANAVGTLLTHPEQLALLRADPTLMPRAVEELIRWCGPVLLSIPRYAREDVSIQGTPIRTGEPVTAAIASANRDPRTFDDPDRLDLTRAGGPPGHLGFAHGPHFCLGAPLARIQTEVAIAALLRRYPDLTLALAPGELRHVPDPGTWRLPSLPVTL